MTLPKKIADILRDEATVKVLTTIDEKGMPHTVFKNSLTALDNGMLAYMELLETGQTQRNMLSSLWYDKSVVISILNTKSNASYQIKGKPFRFLYNGPIWDEFLERTWKIMPDSDPAGVWMIKVVEVLNQDYRARREEEEERILNLSIWRRYIGVRP